MQCASTAERNLLADASRIAERCGRGGCGCGRKKADVRCAVADGLRALGYDAAVCTSCSRPLSLCRLVPFSPSCSCLAAAEESRRWRPGG